jgi:hypothetical protein
MATDTDQVKHQFVPADQPNWPELMSKTVGDLSQIAKTEIELLAANLRRLIESEANRVLSILFFLIASLYGSGTFAWRPRFTASCMAGLVARVSGHRWCHRVCWPAHQASNGQTKDGPQSAGKARAKGFGWSLVGFLVSCSGRTTLNTGF